VDLPSLRPKKGSMFRLLLRAEHTDPETVYAGKEKEGRPEKCPLDGGVWKDAF